ncbi:MAG: hypothetical protein ACJ788_18470 [Ktedonobacteraceae bacterium]
MLKNDTTNNDQAMSNSGLQFKQPRALEIAHALPMRLQSLDLKRHTVIAPDGKRYVVATYDDSRLRRGFVTSVFPQQNDYLTLVRLTIAEYSSATPDEAIQRHMATAESIQKGQMENLSKSI